MTSRPISDQPARGDGDPVAGPPPMSPGDDAPEGTPGTGEGVCPACGGSGTTGGHACANCGGTGKVFVGVGGG